LSFKSSGATNKNFTAQVVEIVRRIPCGRVTTYGIIAAGAGNRCGARQVARILHSCSEKYDLPWHRVVNRNGEISLRSSMAQQFQRNLLTEEGVSFDAQGKIDFDRYLWRPELSK
jgi:methylated-DNA-protein-cysteine methyltransferase-like protein